MFLHIVDIYRSKLYSPVFGLLFMGIMEPVTICNRMQTINLFFFKRLNKLLHFRPVFGNWMGCLGVKVVDIGGKMVLQQIVISQHLHLNRVVKCW